MGDATRPTITGKDAFMARSPLNLSGAWTGVYDYSDMDRGAVSFTADLTDIAGAVWGDVTEPNSFSPIAAKTLQAVLSGTRSGYEVTFAKDYTGDVPGGEHTVHYAGIISDDGRRITGSWRIYLLSGPFVMNKVRGEAIARLQRITEEAKV